MKNIQYYLGMLIFCSPYILYAQSLESNYVRTRTMLNFDGSKYIEHISYSDGLGRVTQQNQKGQSGDGIKDIVTLIQYDNYSRPFKEWIPTAIANDGNRVENLSLFNRPDDSTPYTLTVYGAGPLNLVKQQYGAGEDWHSQNKSVNTDYRYNSLAVTKLKCVKYNVSENGVLTQNGYYDDCMLDVVKTSDEDGHGISTYTDKQGHIILERRAPDDYITFDTYYVYDEVGNLCYVLPPAFSEQKVVTDDLIRKYAYIYIYDNKRNCIEKHLPGEVIITYIYDKANRLRMTQDGNLRNKGEWIYYKYDALGRMVLTGILKANISYSEMKNRIISNNTLIETFDLSKRDLYSCNSYPTEPSLMTTLIADYYDNYNYQQALPPLFDNCKGYISGVSDPEYSEARTMKTGSKVALLNNPTEYLWTTYRYDKNGLPIQTIEMNTLGGLDKEFVKYSFTGQPLEKRLEHTSLSAKPSMTQPFLYTYDHADRLVSTYYGTGTPTLLSKLYYNDLGQLDTKELYLCSNVHERINYKYNIRGWLTDINSGTFKEHLYYADAPNGINKCYNGNISAQTISYPRNSSLISGHTFDYDGLNRLTKATYGEGEQLSVNRNRFDETFTYDLNSK